MTNHPVIHRVSRHDDAGYSSPYIVLRISWRTLTADTLQFQATENENAYFKEVQASNFLKLKAKTYKGSEEEFLRIIRWVLLAEEEGAVDGDFEMSAAITGKTLNLLIRKIAGEAKLRIASIDLPLTDPEEADIDLFAWAAESASHRVKLSGRLSNAQSQSSAEHEQVDELRKKLKELVETKKESEQKLLAKFALLLNEKKRKIRELQRVVEGVQVDSERSDTMQADEDDLQVDERLGAGVSVSARGRKRAVEESDDDDGDDEDNQFRKMDIDNAAEAEADEPDSDQKSDARTTEDEDEERREEEMDLTDTASESESLTFKGKAKSAPKSAQKGTSNRRGREAKTPVRKSKSPDPSRNTRARTKKIKSPVAVVRDPSPQADKLQQNEGGFADEMDDTDEEL